MSWGACQLKRLFRVKEGFSLPFKSRHAHILRILGVQEVYRNAVVRLPVVGFVFEAFFVFSNCLFALVRFKKQGFGILHVYLHRIPFIFPGCGNLFSGCGEATAAAVPSAEMRRVRSV